MKIAIFNPAPKTGNSSFAYNLGFGLTQRGEDVLVVSEGSNSAPKSEDFIGLQTWEGGYQEFAKQSQSWSNHSENFSFFLIDIPSGLSVEASSVLAQCDEVLLLLPQNKLSLEKLSEALSAIKNAMAQNSNLNFRGIVETKKRKIASSNSESNPVTGTYDTIVGLYPNLFKFPPIEDTDEYADFDRKKRSLIKENPESSISETFRKIAAELAPGQEQDRAALRYHKRQLQGKPLTKEGFIERIFSSLFS